MTIVITLRDKPEGGCNVNIEWNGKTPGKVSEAARVGLLIMERLDQERIQPTSDFNPIQALRDAKADIAKVWTVLDDLELTTSETENARNILGLRMHAIDREIEKAEGRAA